MKYFADKICGLLAASLVLIGCETVDEDSSQYSGATPYSRADWRGPLYAGDVITVYSEQEKANEFPDDIRQLLKRMADVATPLMVENAGLCSNRKFVVLKTGREIEICATDLVVRVDASFNAFIDNGLDGGTLMATSAIVRALEPEELAFVIAHELAHHVAQHNISAGSFPHLELEADRVALFLMARAGYDLGAAQSLLQKLIMPNQAATPTHPSLNQRLEVLRTAQIEIEQLKAQGKRLIP